MNEMSSTPEGPGEVVVGVDGSPGSFAVVLHGIGVARDTGAALRLVHVTPFVDPLLPLAAGGDRVLVRHGREILTGMVARARAAAPGQDVRHTLGVGSRHAELARAARRASMVVLGRRERQGLRGLPSGSTAIALAGALSCPVRVVPRDWLSRIHLDDVVVGVDDVRTAAPLLRRGLELAACTSGTLVVAHAWDLPPGYAGVLTPEDVSSRNAHAAAELEHAFTELRLERPTVPVRTEVLPGRPHEVLATLSAEAALVLVGRPDRPHLLGRLGPTPRALLMSSEAPVEVGPRTSQPNDIDPEIAAVPDIELEEDGAMLR